MITVLGTEHLSEHSHFCGKDYNDEEKWGKINQFCDMYKKSYMSLPMWQCALHQLRSVVRKRRFPLWSKCNQFSVIFFFFFA